MKLNTSRNSKIKIYVGLAGIAMCILGLYGFEYLLKAPNEATLIYWQSQGALGIFIVFLISALMLLQGISASIAWNRES